MDYYNKFIKYKLKYISLQNGGSNNGKEVNKYYSSERALESQKAIKASKLAKKEADKAKKIKVDVNNLITNSENIIDEALKNSKEHVLLDHMKYDYYLFAIEEWDSEAKNWNENKISELKYKHVKLYIGNRDDHTSESDYVISFIPIIRDYTIGYNIGYDIQYNNIKCKTTLIEKLLKSTTSKLTFFKFNRWDRLGIQTTALLYNPESSDFEIYHENSGEYQTKKILNFVRDDSKTSSDFFELFPDVYSLTDEIVVYNVENDSEYIGHVHNKIYSYAGQFKFGLKHGYGRMQYPKNVYLGEWKNGIKHGLCKIVSHFPKEYFGEMLYGQKHGYGNFISEIGEYNGNYHQNNKGPYGIFTSTNENMWSYSGKWEDGQRIDYGVYINDTGIFADKWGFEKNLWKKKEKLLKRTPLLRENELDTEYYTNLINSNLDQETIDIKRWVYKHTNSDEASDSFSRSLHIIDNQLRVEYPDRVWDKIKAFAVPSNEQLVEIKKKGLPIKWVKNLEYKTKFNLYNRFHTLYMEVSSDKRIVALGIIDYSPYIHVYDLKGTLIENWEVPINNEDIFDYDDMKCCFKLTPNDLIIMSNFKNFNEFMKYNLNGQLLRTPLGHSDTINSIAIISDDLIVTGSRDTTARLWFLIYPNNFIQFIGHSDSVESVHVTANELIVTGSKDNTIKIWRQQNGICIKTIHNSHYSKIVAISPNNIIISNERFWNLDGDIVLERGLGINPENDEIEVKFIFDNIFVNVNYMDEIVINNLNGVLVVQNIKNMNGFESITISSYAIVKNGYNSLLLVSLVYPEESIFIFGARD